MRGVEIRNHRERVKEAIRYCARKGLHLNIFDREAIVEFFLLEDVLAVLKAEAEEVANSSNWDKRAQMAQQALRESLFVMVETFSSATSIAELMIRARQYTPVRQAIPEHVLAKAAKGDITKKLPKLSTIANDLLTKLQEDAQKALDIKNKRDEETTIIEEHDRNVRKVMGLPSSEEVNAMIDEYNQLINEAEPAIPDDHKTDRKKPNPNI